MGLELRIERSYSTHYNNVHVKISQQLLVKEKHVLEQDTFIVLLTKTKQCRKKVCSFLLLENSRTLYPPGECQTLLSTLGILGFLSICLGSDTLRDL